MSAGNQSGVKAIFSRCLLNCPSVNLWRSYLTFIKTVRCRCSTGWPTVRIAALRLRQHVQHCNRETLPGVDGSASRCNARRAMEPKRQSICMGKVQWLDALLERAFSSLTASLLADEATVVASARGYDPVRDRAMSQSKPSTACQYQALLLCPTVNPFNATAFLPPWQARHHRLCGRGGTQVNEAKGPPGLAEVRKAYEYSADRIGQGAGAGPLWAEHLAFLQVRAPRCMLAGPPVSP